MNKQLLTIDIAKREEQTASQLLRTKKPSKRNLFNPDQYDDEPNEEHIKDVVKNQMIQLKEVNLQLETAMQTTQQAVIVKTIDSSDKNSPKKHKRPEKVFAKTMLQMAVEKKVQTGFKTQVKANLEALQFELKAIRKIESNFQVNIMNGQIMQKPLFRKWANTEEDKESFTNILNILKKPEALRDTKTDLVTLKNDVLQNWTELSKTMASLSQFYHGPLNHQDLIELGKLVQYRRYERGQPILKDRNKPLEEQQDEIYIILKGKVRLTYPLAEFEANETKGKEKGKTTLLNDRLMKKQKVLTASEQERLKQAQEAKAAAVLAAEEAAKANKPMPKVAPEIANVVQMVSDIQTLVKQFDETCEHPGAQFHNETWKQHPLEQATSMYEKGLLKQPVTEQNDSKITVKKSKQSNCELKKPRFTKQLTIDRETDKIGRIIHDSGDRRMSLKSPSKLGPKIGLSGRGLLGSSTKKLAPSLTVTHQSLEKSPEKSSMSSHEESFCESSDDEVDDENLGIPVDDQGQPTEVPFGTLGTGYWMGMKYLFYEDQRFTQLYCMKNTHLLVLDEFGLNQLIKFQKNRITGAKIGFLRNFDQFKMPVSSAKLKWLVGKLEIETRIRGAHLYQEGQHADKVYLVQDGEFIVQKKLVHIGAKGSKGYEAVSHHRHADNTDKANGYNIMRRIEASGASIIPSTIETLHEPNKIKNQNHKMFVKNTQCQTEIVELERVSTYGMLGDEDVGREMDHYQTSVICDSQVATVYSIRKEDFHHSMIKGNKTWWSILQSYFDNKLVHYSESLSKKLETKNQMSLKPTNTGFGIPPAKRPVKKEETKPLEKDEIYLDKQGRDARMRLKDEARIPHDDYKATLPKGANVIEYAADGVYNQDIISIPVLNLEEPSTLASQTEESDCFKPIVANLPIEKSPRRNLFCKEPPTQTMVSNKMTVTSKPEKVSILSPTSGDSATRKFSPTLNSLSYQGASASQRIKALQQVPTLNQVTTVTIDKEDKSQMLAIKSTLRNQRNDRALQSGEMTMMNKKRTGRDGAPRLMNDNSSISGFDLSNEGTPQKKVRIASACPQSRQQRAKFLATEPKVSIEQFKENTNKNQTPSAASHYQTSIFKGKPMRPKTNDNTIRVNLLRYRQAQVNHLLNSAQQQRSFGKTTMDERRTCEEKLFTELASTTFSASKALHGTKNKILTQATLFRSRMPK